MPVVVVCIDVVVVVLPIPRSRVVRRIDIDAVDLASVGELESFEDVMVLALDDYMRGLISSPRDRAEMAQTWED